MACNNSLYGMVIIKVCIVLLSHVTAFQVLGN